MKYLCKTIYIMLISCIICTCFVGCNKSTPKHKYEIEDVYSDDSFNSIIEGELVPVEIKFGIGGEDGYIQFSTKDTEMINAYIEAFRAVKIKQVITDENDMIIVMDGIEDYTFVMEDGTKVYLGTYLSAYIMDGENNKQIVLENNDELKKLNDKIRGR